MARNKNTLKTHVCRKINKIDIPQLAKKALARRKTHQKTMEKLRRFKDVEVDTFFQDTHQRVFENIDCLSCAHCCKTISPIFTTKDIDRIARYLNLKPSSFVHQYLKVDEDGDYVLQSAPCVFLGAEDNVCTIYSHRPKACRAYPHTDGSKIKKIRHLMLKNAAVCPGVYAILESISRAIE